MSVRVIQSFYIGQIVAAFYVEGVDTKSGYLAAFILTACNFIEAIVHHPLFLEGLRTGMDVRIALSSVVYNKVLYTYNYSRFQAAFQIASVFFSSKLRNVVL